MLVIRMQRTGRKGHAQYRIVVQDVRQTPTSGRVVANIGIYNPHTKVAVIDKDKVNFYLKNGAKPSDRTAILFKKEGVKLPSWVIMPTKKSKVIKNVEKLRKNQPEKPAEEAKPADPIIEQPVVEVAEEPTESAEPAKEEAIIEETVDEEPKPEVAKEQVIDTPAPEIAETVIEEETEESKDISAEAVVTEEVKKA